MIDVRAFIRNLGKDAPAFFDTSDQTIRRWLKTGNVPIKAAQKVFAAAQAVSVSSQPEPVSEKPQVAMSPGEDPYTHLPINIDRRLPEIQVQAGHQLPSTIEINPTEQSFGNNLTRIGRPPTRNVPMKLRDEGGVKVAYVDNEPKAPTVLPPSIPREGGWIGPSEPLPQPKKEAKL